MMNRHEGGSFREAKLLYLDGDFEIVSSGSFVTCAITGKPVPLDELRYWSVARQEPYADCAVSLEAEQRAGTLPVRK